MREPHVPHPDALGQLHGINDVLILCGGGQQGRKAGGRGGVGDRHRGNKEESREEARDEGNRREKKDKGEERRKRVKKEGNMGRGAKKGPGGQGGVPASGGQATACEEGGAVPLCTGAHGAPTQPLQPGSMSGSQVAVLGLPVPAGRQVALVRYRRPPFKQDLRAVPPPSC